MPLSNEEALFALALAKPTAERAAWLDRECGEDKALRARLDALLAAHGQPDTVLVTRTEPLRPTTNLGFADAPDEAVGEMLGRYKLLERVGEGGCGVVYVAEQTEPVRRRVALKVIKLGMDTQQVVARFEAERQALALMDHPNICKVFDAGTTETGRPFFVMELVRGTRITDYCDEANLTTRERLNLFTKVCQAIQHAHQKGIIHRDIKPSNILVTLHDGVPVPKVIDFGIAKATEGRLTDATIYTQLHQFIGTPVYMSPEQAEMSGMDIDTRSDIYSLGVLLYELLAGSTPFDATELMASGFDAMRKTIREKEPPRPSTRLATLGADQLTTTARRRSADTAKLMHQLKGDLDWIVMKCLEKDRQRRYETANGLAADIRRHLENEPVLARPPSVTYRMQKFVGKHRVGVTAGVMVLLALVFGLTLATYGLIEAKKDRDIANGARILAHAQEKIADSNAKEAQESARRAELRLAESLIAQANALSMASRFGAAHQLYLEAYDKYAELRQPLIGAEAGLWSSYHQTAFPLLRYTGHTNQVSCVAIGPSGRTAVSSCWDGTLRLWDLPRGIEIRSFIGHTNLVSCVAIGSDGLTAISGSYDKTMKLWDLGSGNNLRTFHGHAAAVISVAIAPDGRTVLSGSDDKTLKLWDLANGNVVRTFIGHTGPVTSVAIAPNGLVAVSSSYDRTLKVWDINSGKELASFTGHTEPARSVAIAPDGRTVLSGSFDNTMKLWDLAGGNEIRTFTGHVGEVYGVAVSRDGRTALSGSFDNTMKLWDLSNGRELRTFTGHRDGVAAVAFAPDGRTALSGCLDGTLMLWDLGAGNELRTLTGHADEVRAIAITPDARTVLSGSSDSTLKLWDMATGKELRAIPGHADGVNAVAIAPDGRTALSGSDDNTLKLWDIVTGKELRTFAGHSSEITSVAIAPNGRTALSGSNDRTLKLWELSSGEELRTFTGHMNNVTGVSISPDGRTALSGSNDATLKLWELASGEELRTFRGHTYLMTGVAFLPDSNAALSSNWDKTLKLWDLVSGTVLRTLSGNSSGVTSLAIAPDGRSAFSGSDDGTMKLWELPSGKELRVFPGHTHGVNGVVVLPGGRRVISCGTDKTLKYWDFTRGPAHRAFESRVAAAQVALQQSSNDPVALANLGEWYAFRGMDPWAVEFLTKARERGATVAPLTLARCYWNLDRLPEARREFQITLEQSKDASEQTYLGLCIAAIDTEPQRKREAEAAVAAAAAAKRLKTEANQGLAAGRTQEALASLAKASALDPKDTAFSLKVAALQAWFGQDQELAATSRRMLEWARETQNPMTADQVAKLSSLRQLADPKLHEAAGVLGRRAVQVGKNHRYVTWFQMSLGMAQFRSGNYTAADEALRAAAQDGGSRHVSGTSAFYLAMSFYKQGKEAEARTIATEAASKMMALPADEKNPLANAAVDADDLILWMAYKEARAMIQFDLPAK